MPHKSRHGQMIMPLNELPSTKAMTCGIAKQFFTDYFGKTMETIANSVFRPWSSARILKQS